MVPATAGRLPKRPYHGTHREITAIALFGLVLLTSGCDRSAPPVAPPPALQSNDLIPAPSTTAPPWFAEEAASVGLDFVHVNGHRDDYLMPEIVGSGAAWFDLEGDGDLDVYFVQSGSLHADDSESYPNRVYRNDDGVFTDITDTSGGGDTGYGMGIATGDIDQDGDVDLYITNVGPNTMLRNNGDGTLTDITESSGTGDGLWGASAAFVDYDADGDLDLYITNYIYWSREVERECLNAFGRRDYCMPNAYGAPALDTLYRNEGDGTFTDVSKAAGIHLDTGNGLGVVCGDFNGDGLVDIYVANDGMRNLLWMNQGDGTFVNRALLAGCAIDQDGREKAGMGVSAMDVDDDGDLDLLVVNLDSEADSFYRNMGDYFQEEASVVGLTRISRPYTRFGVAFVDFDNDGRLDIYQANGKVTTQEQSFLPGGDMYAEPNILIRGLPNGHFEEVAPTGGTSNQFVHVSRAAAFADIDDDGGIDILVTNLYGQPYLLRNIVEQRGHWIGFDVLERSGADAIGATLRFSAGERTIARDVRTGYSYFAANDPRVHVGLGEADSIGEVTVRWGDGAEEVFAVDGAVDQYVTLHRDQARPGN